MDKKNQILMSARDLFLEQGYKSVSVQSIAEKVGISKGAIYLYFKSKEDILLAIFRMLADRVWTEVAAITNHPSWSPREKYRQQIITFYNDILENLQFNQMMLNESGVSLNEDFYHYAREYRYRLQESQEQSLLNIYGDKVSPWLTDIVVSINGVIQELDASILLDGLEIDSERLADFVCQMSDALVEAALKSKPKPLFTEKNRSIRNDYLQEIEDQKKNAISEQYLSLAELAESLQLNGEPSKTLHESLELLKDVLEQSPINKTLAKGLLLNLKEYPELKSERQKMLTLLEISSR